MIDSVRGHPGLVLFLVGVGVLGPLIPALADTAIQVSEQVAAAPAWGAQEVSTFSQPLDWLRVGIVGVLLLGLVIAAVHIYFLIRYGEWFLERAASQLPHVEEAVARRLAWPGRIFQRAVQAIRWSWQGPDGLRAKLRSGVHRAWGALANTSTRGWEWVRVAWGGPLRAGQVLELEVKDASGSVIGRKPYRLDGRLGEGGGLSQVWKAVDVVTGETKAIKVFRAQGIRRVGRDLQYFLAFQDRFGPQHYEEVVQQLLYNDRFMRIVVRTLGTDAPAVIPREGYAWIREANSWALIMEYRTLRHPYLRLEIGGRSQEFREQFALMRRLSARLAEAGAGTLITQVAIDDREPPRRIAWFSVPNLQIDTATDKFVWVDPERNAAALPKGYVVPVFFFGLFREAIQQAASRGFAPDTFQMLDMEAFERFISQHADVLTEEERGHLHEWIGAYRTLSAQFVARSPWMWRDGVSVRRLFGTMRANNIELWERVYREITPEQAVTMRASWTAYAGHWLLRTAKRLPGFAARTVISLTRCLVRTLSVLARWLLIRPVNWLKNTIRFFFSAKYREEAAQRLFEAPIHEASWRYLIPEEARESLQRVYTEFQAMPVYLHLWLWHLLPKPLMWGLRLFGGGQIVLTGHGWITFLLSFVLEDLYRGAVTWLFAHFYRHIDFRWAYWSMVSFAGGYVGIPLQMIVATDRIAPWMILRVRLTILKLVQWMPGFGESGGLLHYRADHALADRFLAVLRALPGWLTEVVALGTAPVRSALRHPLIVVTILAIIAPTETFFLALLSIVIIAAAAALIESLIWLITALLRHPVIAGLALFAALLIPASAFGDPLMSQVSDTSAALRSVRHLVELAALVAGVIGGTGGSQTGLLKEEVQRLGLGTASSGLAVRSE